ncbi:MAG: PEP-CTERM sorting domain-containing protein [Burkholderiales bacterium]|nr:PEP-CTERM sorting domain-containing protein [Burkholderiales bacterium]
MQSRVFVLAFAAAVALPTAPVSAATFDLDLFVGNNATDHARWYEYFSDAYADMYTPYNGFQTPDGFFSITQPGVTYGGGANVFPFENQDWSVGSLTYTDVTGVGVETASITGLSLNFLPYIASFAVVGNSYTTSTSNVSGTVSLYNGAVTAIDLDSNITFTFSTFAGPAPYTGTFSIDDSRFDLFVDQSLTTAFGTFRYAWDVEGSVSGLATAPIPEPSTYALLGMGLAGVGFMARRRKSR